MIVHKLHKYLMQLLITALLICFSMSTSAQSAYHGGKGDGYASAEISNIVLNINSVSNKFQSINLYPNPIKTSENLKINISNPMPYYLEISDLPGRMLFFKNYATENASLPLSGFQAGTYIVRIYNAEFNYFQKLIIVNP